MPRTSTPREPPLFRSNDSVGQLRKLNDNYPTPVSLVTELVHRWALPTMMVWEPCSGDGRLSDALKKRGCKVVATDIARLQDFFDYTDTLAPTIITNPPFRYIRPFIDHAFDIGVQKMALVCPERLWACKKGRDQLMRHRPSRWANMDWREDYLQKGGSPDRALAVAMWERPHSDSCRYEVWTRSHDADSLG